MFYRPIAFYPRPTTTTKPGVFYERRVHLHTRRRIRLAVHCVYTHLLAYIHIHTHARTHTSPTHFGMTILGVASTGVIRVYTQQYELTDNITTTITSYLS